MTIVYIHDAFSNASVYHRHHMITFDTLFPHISRFISARPVSFAGKTVMVAFWAAIMIQNVFVRSTTPPFSSSFYDHSTSTPAVLGTESGQMLASWKEVIAKHPEYPDAYLMAAVSSIKEQQKEQAHTFVNLFLERDPNNTIGRKLLKVLEESY